MKYLEYLRNLEFFFNRYSFQITLVMAILVILLLIFNAINRVKISIAMKKYKELNRFLSASNSEDMEVTLIDYIKEVNFIKNSVDSLDMKYEELSEKLLNSIQQVGFIRYNAFDDMGSDLSFSVALLDEKSNGFVMTNIYAREESHVYAKPITNGTSTYALSNEEKEAVEIAMSRFRKAEIQNS